MWNLVRKEQQYLHLLIPCLSILYQLIKKLFQVKNFRNTTLLEMLLKVINNLLFLFNIF